MSSLTAVDHHGQVLTWREVAALALGQVSAPRARAEGPTDTLLDALVAVRLKGTRSQEQRAVSPEVTYRGPDWKTFLPGLHDQE